MALITDPDDLNQATEVTINELTRRITLNIAGNLSADGVTFQCLYSFLKEEWKTDATLIPYPFPLVMITEEKGEWVDNWELYDDASRKLIRFGGWREYDSSSVLKEEWMGIASLGNIEATSRAYYTFDSLSAKTDFTYDGVVNEAVQTYGDAAHGNFDYRTDVCSCFIRTEAFSYDIATSVDIGIADGDVLDYKCHRYPLDEQDDSLKVTHSDAYIAGNAPYTSMGIEFFATPQSHDVGGSFDFGLEVEGNAGTVEEIYEFLQWSLRQNSDIDDGAGTHLGTLTDPMSVFVGDRLDTLAVVNSEGGGTGVFVNDIATDDTNSIRMIDNTGTYREYPFVSTGRMTFSATLKADTNGIYRMYFTYTEGTAVVDLAVSSSAGASASLDSTGGNLPSLSQNDYIFISGMVNPENNGIWKITDATPSGTQADADKFDGIDPTDESSVSSIVGVNPYGSPQAIIVDDNSDVDIAGTTNTKDYEDFDFDYDGNVQGGRTAGVDVETTIVAIGHDTAQFVVATLTIEAKVGNNVTLVSNLERNYANA